MTRICSHRAEQPKWMKYFSSIDCNYYYKQKKKTKTKTNKKTKQKQQQNKPKKYTTRHFMYVHNFKNSENCHLNSDPGQG